MASSGSRERRRPSRLIFGGLAVVACLAAIGAGNSIGAIASAAMLAAVILIALGIWFARRGERLTHEHTEALVFVPGHALLESVPPRYRANLGTAGRGIGMGRVGDWIVLLPDALEIRPGRIATRQGMRTLHIPRIEVAAVRCHGSFWEKSVELALKPEGCIRLRITCRRETAHEFETWLSS